MLVNIILKAKIIGLQINIEINDIVGSTSYKWYDNPIRHVFDTLIL